jgi:hypothetical protein
VTQRLAARVAKSIRARHAVTAAFVKAKDEVHRVQRGCADVIDRRGAHHIGDSLVPQIRYAHGYSWAKDGRLAVMDALREGRDQSAMRGAAIRRSWFRVTAKIPEVLGGGDPGKQLDGARGGSKRGERAECRRP